MRLFPALLGTIAALSALPAAASAQIASPSGLPF